MNSEVGGGISIINWLESVLPDREMLMSLLVKLLS